MAQNTRSNYSSTRAVWKGAVNFGLLHIPIGLYSATSSSDTDFNWLDKRTLQPVGYKRINKATGEELKPSEIVKGVEYENGKYVVLTEEEIMAAFPKLTRAIEIEAFIEVDEIPFIYLEKPYYTAPLNGGEKTYALLREALKKSNKVGISRIVIQTKQHLALLIPCGRALILNLLRWGGEIRPFEALNLPPLDPRDAGIKASEIRMALALINEMTQPWDADQFRNSFQDEIHRLLETKIQARDAQALRHEPNVLPSRSGSEVMDLTTLLERSLLGRNERPRKSVSRQEENMPSRAPRNKASQGARRHSSNAATAAQGKFH